MRFSEALSLVLEDSADCTCLEQPAEKAMAIVRKVDAIKQQLLDLQNDLMAIKNQFKGDIAFRLKRAEPAFNINVGQNEPFKCGCLDKTLRLEPDMDKMEWVADSDDQAFANDFTVRNQSKMALVSDLTPMIDAILGHYRGYSEKLGESIEGKGIALVEGRMSTLKEIVEWRDRHINKRPFPLRRERRS